MRNSVKNEKERCAIMKKSLIKNTVYSIICITLAVLLIVFSDDTAQAIRGSISVCTETLIPSLFAYMLLSTIIIQSPVYSYITFPLWFILKRIIKLDRKLFSILLISQIAGYPTGIKLLNDYVRENPEKISIAQKIAPACYSSGPAFSVGIVGNVLFHSKQAGLICFLANVMSNLIAAVFITRKNKNRYETTDIINIKSNKTITNATLSTAKAMLIVCLSMIVFNTLYTLIEMLISLDDDFKIYHIIKSLWEITNIRNATNISVPIASFLLSLGGLCVLYQIYSISEINLDIKKYTSARILISLISGLISLFLINASGYVPAVNSSVNYYYYISNLSNNLLVLLCIIIMSLMLLYQISPVKTKKSKKIHIFSKKD